MKIITMRNIAELLVDEMFRICNICMKIAKLFNFSTHLHFQFSFGSLRNANPFVFHNKCSFCLSTFLDISLFGITSKNNIWRILDEGS